MVGGLQSIRDSWSNIQTQCDRLFPDWEKTDERDLAAADGDVRRRFASAR